MGSFSDKLRSINLFRRVVKRTKIYREYLYDAANYSKYYIEEAKKNGDYRYQIML